MSIKIFCDFDGTVTLNDVGNLVFTRFGDANYWWGLVDQWKRGEIDGRELWTRQAETIRLTNSELNEFAASQKIDKHFIDFVTFCESKDYPIYILSDGMDAYIKKILDHNNLENIEIRSNHLDILSDGKVNVEFPYYKDGCQSCANCKGYHIRKDKKPGDTMIYVGDGYSDICALNDTDLVFAKKDLLNYCEKHNIDYVPFQDFADVKRELLTRFQ